MARVQVPEGASIEPMVPSGTYSEGVKTVSCEERDVPGEQNKGEKYLDIGVLIPSKEGAVFAHTTPFGRHHCRTGKGTGSKVEAMVTQLGFDPRDFDTDDLVGLPVTVEVEQRTFTSKGETRTQVNIINIARQA